MDSLKLIVFYVYVLLLIVFGFLVVSQENSGITTLSMFPYLLATIAMYFDIFEKRDLRELIIAGAIIMVVINFFGESILDIFAWGTVVFVWARRKLTVN